MNTNSYYVYIMSNWNNKVFYVGVTDNLVRRIYEHKNKLNDGFTKKYNINKLLYYENTSDVNTAIEREKQIKRLLRWKKIELIKKSNPNFIDLYDNIIQ